MWQSYFGIDSPRKNRGPSHLPIALLMAWTHTQYRQSRNTVYLLYCLISAFAVRQKIEPKGRMVASTACPPVPSPSINTKPAARLHSLWQMISNISHSYSYVICSSILFEGKTCLLYHRIPDSFAGKTEKWGCNPCTSVLWFLWTFRRGCEVLSDLPQPN